MKRLTPNHTNSYCLSWSMKAFQMAWLPSPCNDWCFIVRSCIFIEEARAYGVQYSWPEQKDFGCTKRQYDGGVTRCSAKLWSLEAQICETLEPWSSDMRKETVQLSLGTWKEFGAEYKWKINVLLFQGQWPTLECHQTTHQHNVLSPCMTSRKKVIFS